MYVDFLLYLFPKEKYRIAYFKETFKTILLIFWTKYFI